MPTMTDDTQGFKRGNRFLPSQSTMARGAVLAFCVAGFFSSHSKAEPAQVTLAQVPEAVQNAIKAQLGSGSVSSIERDEEDGDATFDVEIAKDGHLRDFTWTDTGRLISLEAAFSETPVAVRNTITAQLGRNTLDEIKRIFDPEGNVFLVEITTTDGRESEFVIAEDGKLLSVDLALAETPVPVQSTIASRLAGGTLKEITKIIDDSVTYDVEATTKDGKDLTFTIAEDGKLQSEEITLAEVPEAAKKTIQEHVGNGTILAVFKSYITRDKVLPFDVEAIKDGKSLYFSVGPKGRFLGTNDREERGPIDLRLARQPYDETLRG
jgi:uncharacterized membrane protein YkoI